MSKTLISKGEREREREREREIMLMVNGSVWGGSFSDE